MQKKQNIVVFGGTFDPPHNGHSFLAEKIITDQHADKILFIPALHPPHKDGCASASYMDRLEMVNLVVDNMNKNIGDFFGVSSIEGERKSRLSYTFDTMVELENRYPENNYILLIGEDSLLHIDTWYKADEIISKWKILTYPRNCIPGGKSGILNELKKKWPENIAYLLFESILHYELYDISSTEIRSRIADHKDVSNMISKEVYQYINEKGLYKRG